VSPPVGVDQEFEEKIGLCVDYLWSGLRRTPATNDLLANCIHKFCAFTHLFLAGSSEWDSCYGEKWIDHLKLKYGPLGGHSRTAKVLCADLAPAVRSGLGELVDVISSDDVLSVNRALVGDHIQQMIYPQYLFDFEMFVSIFITRILPYEAFVAGVMRRRTPIELAFNPRLIKVFGLA
jgi:hypothetical protein